MHDDACDAVSDGLRMKSWPSRTSVLQSNEELARPGDARVVDHAIEARGHAGVLTQELFVQGALYRFD